MDVVSCLEYVHNVEVEHSRRKIKIILYAGILTAGNGEQRYLAMRR